MQHGAVRLLGESASGGGGNDGPDEPPARQAVTAGPYFRTRLVLLVVWLVGVNLWLSHHTGYGLQDPGVIGGLGGAVAVVLWGASKIIASVDKALWDALPGKIVKAAVHGPALAALYLVAAFFMLNLSSLWVIHDDAGPPSRVTVGALSGGGGEASWLCKSEGPQSAEAASRHCLWTGPFGSTFRVSVEGFLDRSIEVFPLIGKRIRPDRTFQRLPTLLVRPSRNALKSLKSCETDDSGTRCGQFRLCEVEGTQCRPILTIEGHSGSFLVGWTKAVPQGLVQDWQFELMAQGLFDVPKVRAEMIIAWKNEKRLVPGSNLGAAASPDQSRVPLIRPGTRLRAEVRTKIPSRPLVSCREFTVEDLPFMDIALESTVGSGKCPI